METTTLAKRLLSLATGLAMLACGAGLTSHPGDARLRSAVKATLTAPESVRTGTTFTVGVTLTNASAEAVRIDLAGLPTRPYIEVVITRSPGGDTVVTLFNSQTMLRVLHTRVLGPGESVELTAQLALPGASDRSLPPGNYLMRARVLADPTDWTTPPRALTVTL